MLYTYVIVHLQIFCEYPHTPHFFLHFTENVVDLPYQIDTNKNFTNSCRKQTENIEQGLRGFRLRHQNVAACTAVCL